MTRNVKLTLEIKRKDKEPTLVEQTTKDDISIYKWAYENLARALKLECHLSMKQLHDVTNPTPKQVYGACMSMMLNHWTDPCMVARCVAPTMMSIPHNTSLPDVHLDWIQREEVIKISQDPPATMLKDDAIDIWIQSLSIPQAVVALGVIEWVVDESCLGYGVRGPVTQLWDALSLFVKKHKIQTVFLGDWTPETWQKIEELSL